MPKQSGSPPPPRPKKIRSRGEVNFASNTVRSLYVTMSDNELETMIQSVGVNENESRRGREMEELDKHKNAYHSETVSAATDAQQHKIMNPFEHIESNQNETQNITAGSDRGPRKYGGP